MSRRSARSSSIHVSSSDDEDDRKPAARPVVDVDDDDSSDDEGGTHRYHDDESGTQVTFTQQVPEPSQPMAPVKDSERRKWDNLGRDSREKVVMDLTRLLLFKGLAGEPMDKRKCAKEALGDFSSDRITEAALEEAATRLHDVFGFELRRVPAYMEKRKGGLPNKYKDRLYLINGLEDEEGGTHSKAIHSVHPQHSIAKGLLMVILAVCYCKGESRNDGSRWITDVDLYAFLNGVDENIPAEPPAPTSRKNHQAKKNRHVDNDNSETPNVDVLLEQFVHEDYLLKEKEQENDQGATQTQGEDAGFVYSMGPRAALEIGRKQIIYFCAEILDEEPDPAMLAEIEDDDEEEEEEEEAVVEIEG